MLRIEQEIAAWDGKSADDIRAIYEAYHEQPDFADTIIKLTQSTSHQNGSTWLLKAWLEAGNELGAEQIQALYALLPLLEHWEARLHLLQCIPHVPIPEDRRRDVDAFLRQTRTDSNKFVRAWSYNGLYELATQFPQYADEVEQLFVVAMQDEAASVKARIRNIAKKGF